MNEDYPLLFDDLSEDEKSVQYFRKRSRPMILRGRSGNKIKGAAAIIRHWPDHWTSVLTFWWIILGMIALTTLIVYNTLFSFAALHPAYPKPAKPLQNVLKHYKSTDFLTTPDVFMHVFVSDKEEIDLDKYLPYIEIISNEYKRFKYHFVIVSNDTVDSSDLSDELNNDLAFNTLWSKKENFNNIMPKNSNIAIEHILLSQYLNNSPLQKHWKSLPTQFIQFLVRAISIWEKGGIAVNPVVFTPQSPNSIYINKVKKILQTFFLKKSNVNSKKASKNIETPNVQKGDKKYSTANNIRDIIDALESDENFSTHSNLEMLDMAESKTVNDIFKNNSGEQFIKDSANRNSNSSEDEGIKQKIYQSIHNMLPRFLNYLYNNDKLNENTEANNTARIRRSPVTNAITKEKELVKDLKANEGIKPMIVRAKGLIDNDDLLNKTLPSDNDSSDDMVELTVDLQGNIIATETPCHAFVGDIFTNAVHHDGNETLTDFIIKELSTFCKGLMASCLGVDVILI